MGYVANQRVLLIETIVLVALTMLAVGARFWVRSRLKATLGPDDWCILAAGIVFWGNNISMWWSIDNEYAGVDPATMKIEQIKTSLKLTLSSIILMSVILTLCRLSVLFLYNRLFGIYRTFRKVLIIYGIISISWMITIWFGSIFRCNPISGSWDITAVPHCAFDIETFFVCTESINAALDIILVVLPISKIRTLHLPVRDRIGLAFIFIFGGFVGLTSVLRIVFTYNPTKRGALIDSVFWLWVQLATAIICACLPIMRSLIPTKQLFSSVSSTVRQLLASRTTKTKSSSVDQSLKLDNSDKSNTPVYVKRAVSSESDGVELTAISRTSSEVV